MNRPRPQVVALTVLLVIGVGGLVAVALWFQHLNKSLNPYRVADAGPAAEAAAGDIGDQPDVARADAQGELADGRPGDLVTVAVRPGTPPDRVGAVVRHAADRMRGGDAKGQLLVTDSGTDSGTDAGSDGESGPDRLTLPVPAPAASVVDDALDLWLGQAAALGALDVSVGSDGALAAELRLRPGTSAPDVFERLRGARPAGSVPVRWSLQAGSGYATTFASDADVPPPAVLRVMGTVPAAPASGHLVLTWVAGTPNPEHLLVVVEVHGPWPVSEQEGVQEIVSTFRDALDGSGVPFAVRVATYDGQVLLQANHW